MFKTIYDGLETRVDANSKIYSKFYAKYMDLTKGTLIEGCKLNPIDFADYPNDPLASNKYYYLKDNITLDHQVALKQYDAGGTTMLAVGWVFNAQGFEIIAKDGNGNRIPVFDTITRNSAVSALMLNISGDVEGINSMFAPLAIANEGFVYASSVVGKINTPLDVSSFVYSNSGVINKCFSMTDISIPKGSTSGAGGLVSANGTKSADGYKIGNIYDSYYTGSIEIFETNNTTPVGTLAKISAYGVISNSYTMADFSVAEGTDRYNVTYPVARVSSLDGDENWKATANFYRVYYDYIPYVAGNEGQNISAISDRNINSNFISNTGFYLWTVSFLSLIHI